MLAENFPFYRNALQRSAIHFSIWSQGKFRHRDTASGHHIRRELLPNPLAEFLFLHLLIGTDEGNQHGRLIATV